MYDIADSKALYIYTEHSHWASSFKPFLLCKCECGEDPAITCQIIKDDDYKLAALNLQRKGVDGFRNIPLTSLRKYQDNSRVNRTPMPSY